MNNIEILEKLKDEQYTKETVNTLYEFYDEEFKPYVLSTEERDALENLIQENKELKEENNKLKTCDGIFDVFRAGKESSRQRIEFDYIPKSKVKEKIEELENEFEYLGEDNKRVNKMTIETLQELLEEGE